MVPQSELDLELVKSILSEYRIHNADITLRYIIFFVLAKDQKMALDTYSKQRN
jgi:ribosome-interacting GTPase 1